MLETVAEISITPDCVTLNGTQLATSKSGAELLTELYRMHMNDYPKYFKMDGLCRLGFIASELLLKSLHEERFIQREDRAVLFLNTSGSIDADHHYQSTISDKEEYFPSPSIFVYTLPNIVTGEIAIRNNYHGETAFYILDHYETSTIHTLVNASFMDKRTESVLVGWVDFHDSDQFTANVKLINKSTH